MFTVLMVVAGMLTGFVIRETLLAMRNRRGLYGWPRWVQALICIVDRIPLSAVGQYPNNEAFLDALDERLRSERQA